MNDKQIEQLLSSCKDDLNKRGQYFQVPAFPRDSNIYMEMNGFHYTKLPNGVPQNLAKDQDIVYFHNNKDIFDAEFFNNFNEHVLLFIKSADFVLNNKSDYLDVWFDRFDHKDLSSKGYWSYPSLVYNIDKKDGIYTATYKTTLSAKNKMIQSLDDLKNVEL